MTFIDPHDPQGLHDHDDPVGYLNALEVSLLAARGLCPTCDATATMLAMPGPGWGLDVTHEPGCPVIEVEDIASDD